MIDFTLAELLTGLDFEPVPPVTLPVSKPDESSVATDEAEAKKPER